MAFPCTIGVLYTSQVFLYRQNRILWLLTLKQPGIISFITILVLLAAKQLPFNNFGSLYAGTLFHVFPPSLVIIERQSGVAHCYSFVFIPKLHTVVKTFALFS
jgi:hypothetical protein